MIGRLIAGAQVCVVGDPPVPGPSSPSFITSGLALIPWVHLDSADVPGEHDQLRLMQRGQEPEPEVQPRCRRAALDPR